MSDLISREALIERYAKEYAKNLIVYGVNIEEKLETATQISCALNQAYMRGRQDELDNIARRQVPQWIPCSERLPKYSDVYQITRKVFEGECVFYIADCAYFDGQNAWHSDNRVNHGREYLKDVIAWCPLQPAYKGE